MHMLISADAQVTPKGPDMAPMGLTAEYPATYLHVIE